MEKVEILRRLTGMPRMDGQLKYPGGSIVTMDFIQYKGKTPPQIFFRSDNKWDKMEKRFLKDYIIYFLHSPIIEDRTPPGLINRIHALRDPNKMFELCIDVGVNPF